MNRGGRRAMLTCLPTKSTSMIAAAGAVAVLSTRACTDPRDGAISTGSNDDCTSLSRMETTPSPDKGGPGDNSSFWLVFEPGGAYSWYSDDEDLPFKDSGVAVADGSTVELWSTGG